RQVFGASILSAQALTVETEGADSAIHVIALGLWIIVAVVGLVGTVAVGIVVYRETALFTFDQPTLAALGATRRQRTGANGPAAVLVAAAGAGLAMVAAVAASPLFPICVARRADPDIGLHADWHV